MYNNYNNKPNPTQRKSLTVPELLSIIAAHNGSGSKISGKNHMVNCPAHDDKHASLGIAEGHDGKILLNCFVGCQKQDICNVLGIHFSQLFPQKGG